MKRIVPYAAAIVVLIAVLAGAETPQIDGAPFWSTSELNVTTTGMTWRDANRDGIVDAFYSNGNDITQSPNMLYLFDGNALPSAAVWYSSNHEYSGHGAVGDVNDDGWPDFAVANYLGTGWYHTNVGDLYLNVGGNLDPDPAWQTPDSMFSFSCAMGDVDNDGDLDIAFATGEGYTGYRQPDRIYRNADGMFEDSAWWQSAVGTQALDVAWGDVDNDGDLDLAFCYDGDATAVYYNHNGTIEASPSWQAATVESGNTLMFGDMDGDGWLDLIVAYNNQNGGNGYFRVYQNNGAGILGTTAAWQSATGGYGSALALYDYDNDGDDDLAAGRWFNRLMIYENTGSVFTTSPVWQSVTSVVAEELAWADLDGAGVENLCDTFPCDGSRSLFYTRHHPLYEVDSLVADGMPLDYPDFCYDAFSGWVSLAEAPQTDLKVHYRYSFRNDLTVCNWDTVSMAFENTAAPLVHLVADPSVGWAPLEVQFIDSSVGATSWDWDFGDGRTSALQNPIVTFAEAGAVDVQLTVELPDGPHNRTVRHAVAVLGDTLTFSDVVFPVPGNHIVQVELRNSQPMYDLTLPLSFAGDLEMSLTDVSVAGCRTDYFEDVRITQFNPWAKTAVVFIAASSTGAGVGLPPGDGAVLNLHFTVGSGGATEVTVADGTSDSLWLDASYAQYRPKVVSLRSYVGSCGNLDGSTDGVVDIADITRLIEFLFITFEPPAYAEHANIDGSADGVVDVGDLTDLIGYLFLSGPPPYCP
ncbi:MAG: VCBS repeat-containing protein [candidate division Zixibacteria bacterium]|nr:VCBS repeat-containing protein [candidate division Zixibacteria bacterium]